MQLNLFTENNGMSIKKPAGIFYLPAGSNILGSEGFIPLSVPE